MKKFAKLFERDGRQVLVTKDKNEEDDCPELRFQSTTASGHSLTTCIIFGEDDWESQENAFETVDENFAFEVVANSPCSNL